MTVDVEQALDALEARGARTFDVAACDCVRTLLTRGETLGGRAGELLRERASAHLSRLQQRFEDAQSRTYAALESAERERGKLSKLRESLARGDVTTVRRKLRRLSTEPLRAAPLEKRRRLTPQVDYEDALAELVASFALARALDVVPEHAGPYNPLRIASDLLTRMRTVSPIYLTAQLNRLEELASMMELPELPEPASKTLPRKKRGALRSGS